MVYCIIENYIKLQVMYSVS